ncbi:AzlC family ABC transporter permease [Pseudodesulfovibrio portus]|uniref:Branched-chain amino acid transporter AzlC n=1 Tax=Pseudodesulfovibrio portus TaxID=231439 RepID=A0ABN6RYI7_9BACT|nr:AzlC family ABC transporter permease [Pseudodesulfovibrio portus]BDQ34506.1 branched-chain amino acid transporter AzlC [Pseudodesulfovibrio portus]
MDKRSSFLQGVRDLSPILLGVLPFGLICGAVGVAAGMPEWAATSLSAIVFAGASQLVAVQLMDQNASVAVVILTGLIINARFLMYSASIAPHLKDASPLGKLGLAYLLTDQAYATSVFRFGRDDLPMPDKIRYYLGAGLTLWVAFNLTTALGAYLGAIIPPQWELDFAIPLTFTALVIPAVKDRPAALAAAAAGCVALLAVGLPYNLGLMAAAVCGIAAGCLAEREQRHG